MKKLRLHPDELRVESFATREDADAARGTVQAHDFVITPRCVETDAANTCWCTERNCP